MERHESNKSFAEGVYWGDTHLHSSYSTDADMIGNKLPSSEAYSFAWEKVASGLNAVWSRDNTRYALFEAIQKKETYAATCGQAEQRLLQAEVYRTIKNFKIRGPQRK